MNPHVQISWQVQHFVNLHAQIAWQAQYFVNLHAQISWQAQHFVNLDVQIAQQAQYVVNLHVQMSWQAQHFVNLHASPNLDGEAPRNDGCEAVSRHGRNRPSIVIRVFTCFLKCRFRGRHSAL